MRADVLREALERAPDPIARTTTNRRLAEAALAVGAPEEALGYLAAISMDALEPGAVESVKLLTAASQLAAGRPQDASEALATLASRESIEATRLEIQILLAIAAETGTVDATVHELAGRLLERDPLGADSILVRAQAMIESDADLSEGRRLLRTVAGRLAASAATPPVLLMAALGRPAGDARMDHVLAEAHSALANDSTGFARDRHLEAARAHLAPLLAMLDDGDTTIRAGAILRLDAELQPAGASVDDLTAREVRAGDALLDEGDALGAIEVLQGTVNRPAAPSEATWLLTEAMRLRAVELTEADEAGLAVAEVRKLINEATRLWDLKFVDEVPTDEAWWAFAARALLAYQRSTWVDDQPLAAVWEAIAFQHVAVLREPWSPRLLLLAQLLRLADLDVTGLLAADEAVELDDAPANLSELCVGQLNTGDVEGALLTIGDAAGAPGSRRRRLDRRPRRARGLCPPRPSRRRRPGEGPGAPRRGAGGQAGGELARAHCRPPAAGRRGHRRGLGRRRRSRRPQPAVGHHRPREEPREHWPRRGGGHRGD